MERFEVNLLLRCAVDFPLQDELECCGVRLKVNNGVVYGTATVDAVNREEARRRGYQLAEDVASALTLVFGRAFVVERVNVAKVGRQRAGGSVVIKVVVEATTHAKVILVKWPRNWKELAATLMESLIAAGEKPEKLKRLMRVLKWWRAGDVDDDPLDKFLKFYIAFELLAAAQRYRGKYHDWVKRFCNDYGITYRINKWRLSDIRNSLVHEPGEEREEAEKLAAQHAERFGLELLEAIRKAILQPSGPPVDASASKNCETESGCGDQ